MKKCNALNCTRRTPDKIDYCCEDCESININAPAGMPAPDSYPHSALCDAREIAARNGTAIPVRPVTDGGKFPAIEREKM